MLRADVAAKNSAVKMSVFSVEYCDETAFSARVEAARHIAAIRYISASGESFGREDYILHKSTPTKK